MKRFQGVVSAVGVARVIGFAHPAHNSFELSTVCNGSGKGDEQQIAAWHKGVGQATFFHLNGFFLSERGVAYLAQQAQVKQVVLTEFGRPIWKFQFELRQKGGAALKLNRMPLAVVEADGLNVLKTLEGPGQASGRVLTARKKYQSGRIEMRHE